MRCCDSVIGTCLLAAVIAVGCPPPLAAQAVAEWTIAQQPGLTIGTAADAPHRLASIRGAVRLASGVVVVAEGRSSELRFFDARGAHLRTVGLTSGTAGRAPVISGIVALPGDTVVVGLVYIEMSAASELRLAFFSAAGAHIRTQSVSSAPVRQTPHYEIHPSGAATWFLRRAGTAPQGLSRHESPLFVTDRTGRTDSIGHFPTEEVVYVGSSGFARPLARSLLVGRDSDGRVFVGTGDRAEIEVFDRTGRAQGTIRMPEPALRVSAADRGVALSRVRPEHHAVPGLVPDELPPYRSLRVDAGGRLWVERNRHEGDQQTVWWIFDPATRARIADARTPPGSTVLEIGRDYLLLQLPDGSGGRIVQLRGLRRT